MSDPSAQNPSGHSVKEPHDYGDFNDVFRVAPVGIVLRSADGVILDANDAALRLFGLSRDELVGRTNAELGLLPEGPARDLELSTLSKTGERRDVIVSVQPIETTGERRTVTTFVDITARKRAEEKSQHAVAGLREENALYQSVLGALSEVGEGVVINDGPRWVWANDAFARMLGYTVDELLALPSHVPLIALERAAQEQRVRARLSGQLPDHDEIKMLHRSGELVEVEYGTKPLHPDNPARRVAVVRDVTERKQMQARMTMVDRMASVGTLAAGVAHEINNPLAYVTANLDMIAEEVRGAVGEQLPGRTGDLATMVNEARLGIERIRKIVRGLHAFSRADEERRAPLDVRNVLEQSINMASNEIRHRARLVKDYRETLPVNADETRLGQVFVNLIVNAAQSIPEGHTDQNEIRLTTEMDAAHRVIVAVSDTGRGIAPHVMARIFDPFFTTKEIGQGTGLGLSICHGIVTALGGEITVESTPGKGSVFRVALPVAQHEVAPVEETLAAARPAPVHRRGEVLVVDDDVLVGTTLRRVLSKEHEVTVVTDGKQALDLLLAGRHFDVVLCDLMMPYVSGMDLLAQLASSRPELVERVVFITGGAFTTAAREFLAEIPNQRLEKPFVSQNVRAIVRSLVR